MQKGTSARWKLLLSAVALVLVTSPALAIPGPETITGDGTPNWFKSRMVYNPEATNPATKVLEDTQFFEELGWDFGDRSQYDCEWIEFYSNPIDHASGTELFEVQYRLISNYQTIDPAAHAEINDVYGTEGNDTVIRPECLGDSPPPFVADGSDHHPHGTSLVFYKDGNADGRIDAIPADEFARIDYLNQCTKLYWTPGNDPGEAWLWWDEDGPTDTMGPGSGGCPNGGPGDPFAIVRAKVRNVASGVAYCVTDEMDGDVCVGLTPPVPPPTPVTLGAGQSVLTCPGGSTPAVVSTEPLVVNCA